MRTSIPSLADLNLQPGSILLEQWRLIRELGRGGFGAVFEAEELHLKERQAVKVLDPAMVAKEELLARFRREVSLMRKLVHPRIVRVFDYREDPRQLVALISMELVSGGSVRQLLALARERDVGIPIPLALEILGQTLEALAEAHRQGVIHRDVTPGNVLLAGGSPEQLLQSPERDPQVKLVDFGIAGLVERSELSQKSRVLGTAAYVAPEVLDPSVEVTPAADIYGAGAIGYELLTGKLPLGRFTEPTRLRAAIAKPVNDFVLSLLEAQPTSRPAAGWSVAKAQALLDELDGRRAREIRREIRRQEAGDRALWEAEEAHSRQIAAERERQEQEALQSEEQGKERRSTQEVPGEVAISRIEQARKPVGSSLSMGAWLGIGFLIAVLVWWFWGVQEQKKSAAAARASAAQALRQKEAETKRQLDLQRRKDELDAKWSETRRKAASDIEEFTQSWANRDNSIQWMRIPSGRFPMGCSPGDDYCEEQEKPAHSVFLSKAFLLAQTETTNGQYWSCVKAGSCERKYDDVSLHFDGRRDPFFLPENMERPVVLVSWEEARSFCAWAGGRLPTEAEWEWAARGGIQGARFPWGDDAPSCDAAAKNGAQFRPCGSSTVPVRSFQPNGYGLFGMAGNVSEMVGDYYNDKYYSASEAVDPQGPTYGQWSDLREGKRVGGRSDIRVDRGGGPTDARYIRVSYRGYVSGARGTSRGDTGFRCAKTLRE